MESLDLADALAQAARDINTRQSLPDVLQRLVETAQNALPGVDHVGISITHRDGRVETLAATDPLVLALDELQYELNEGPCLSAIREHDIVVVNLAEQDPRWPRFMERATELGLRSQMGLRLFSEDETLGGLNLYSTQSDTIDPDVVSVAMMFASHIALALGKARLEGNLSAGLQSRQLIGQATGIVMERYGLDQDRAFQYLTRVSQNSNIKLRDVAAELVASTNERNGMQPRFVHENH